MVVSVRRKAERSADELSKMCKTRRDDAVRKLFVAVPAQREQNAETRVYVTQ